MSESFGNQFKIEQEDQIQKRFTEELFDASADSEYVQSIFTALKEYGYRQNEFENIFKNVSNNQSLREEIRRGGPAIEHLVAVAGDKEFSSEEIAALIFNNNERQSVLQKNQQELKERTANNPLATDEEYRLGTYVEAIEPQVRDAVFDLLKKGYSPVESGFFDLSVGSQYIGIQKNEGIDSARIVEAINKNFNEDDKKVFSESFVKEYNDRIQIVLVPKIRTIPLGTWRLFWNSLVSSLPDISSESNNMVVINNGLQGKRFRENQDRLRQSR